ncbi:hypothetical protein [Paraflavitalea sp. CAU 1676]|uniref:hypothetical protein n=1 Tax=Paraflavitalea sp. CAU 1676 TaxID=3032598 RepID=UPI0023DBBD12|nr:hypothetical protein [Paraflavitalea sp. CAU 1676]MDF2191382.1 hypothetical protein [Paraflavitalea sp. CAU 1676]
MKSLQEKAMLVNITIRQWTGKKLDRKVSREIEAEHSAHNAGNYNKNLLGDTELRTIQSIANEIRNFLREQTLPWSDTGDRLLPATNYFKFIEGFRPLEERYSQATSDFIKVYPELKIKARMRLNDLYNENDYPKVSQLVEKFTVSLHVTPIADQNDFRVEMNASEINSLKEKIYQDFNARIDNASQEIWQRIYQAVSLIVERLSADKAKIFDSLMNNLKDLTELLPRLNFTGNKDVNNVIRDMKHLFENPENLRASATIRNEKATEAKELLDRYASYFQVDNAPSEVYA